MKTSRNNLMIIFSFFLGFAALYAVERNSPDCQATFDFTLVHLVICDPHLILQQEEKFWQQQPAMELYQSWAAEAGLDSLRPKWREKLAAFARLSPTERENSQWSQLTRKLLERAEFFKAHALVEVCSFFPPERKIDFTVYFLAFIQPRSFVHDGIVVVDVASDYWSGNVDALLVSLVREMGHAAFAQMRDHRRETPHPNHTCYRILDELCEQGLATFIAYTARSQYPLADEADFRSLENPEEVNLFLRRLNKVFARAGRLNDAKFIQLAQQIKSSRAYAVVGAHMAQVIEKSSGREVLAQTIQTGPLALVTAYNALVDESHQLHVPDAETISARQRSQLKLRFFLDRLIIGIIVVAVIFILCYYYRRNKIMSDSRR